jgi:hypothetical protein
LGDEVSGTICPGWPWTGILQISASQAARIIGWATSAWLDVTLINSFCERRIFGAQRE